MLEDALRYVTEAGEAGIDLLVFPETYPGPVSWHTRYEVIEPLQAAAAEHQVAVVAGTTEKAAGGDQDYYIACVVITSTGEVLGRYRRTHPRSEVYRGLYAAGPFWEFNYIAADDLPVFDMGWGILGISICSEIFVPEVARSLALSGAELCVFPTGAMIDDLGLTANWHTLVRARAIENNMYTATTMNLFSDNIRKKYPGAERQIPVEPGTRLNRGHALIASPEEVLGTMRGPGILSADIDLGYVRRMRAEAESPDGVTFPAPYTTLPGIFDLGRPDLARQPM